MNEGMKRALQAIALLALVVLFNLGLYVFILWLVVVGWITGTSPFPSFVLFLSFALSLGIILIVALGEKIDTSKVDNEWIKAIGATPIMVIVSVLIATFVSIAG